MAYIKQNFNNGDILTAENLILMEEGIIGNIDMIDNNTTQINDIDSVVDYLINHPTEGLAYELSADGTYYLCAGVGTATATDIIIAPVYNRLPVKEIKTNAFYNTAGAKVTSVIIPSGVTVIRSYAFRNCAKLANISLPDTLTTIETGAFQKCTALTNCVISDGVTAIGNSVFNGCTALTTLTIGKSVKTIGTYALQNCTALTHIRFNAVEMNNLNKNNYVLLSVGHLSDGVDILIDRNVKSIPANLFHPSSNIATYPKLTSVRFEDNSICTRIDEQAFSNCQYLSNINLPHGLLEIKANAFESCTNLTRVTIPDTVTSIETYVFRNCTNLEHIDIPDSVVTIGASAFRDCPKLKHVELPKGLTEITKSLFEMTIPDDKPDLVITESIKSVIIPRSVTNIIEEVFLNCVELTDIYYTGTKEEWEAITVDPVGNEKLLNANIHYSFANDFVAAHNKLVPPATTSDEGFFLRIIGGVPTWASIPIAEHNAF